MLALSCSAEAEKPLVSVYNWESNITHITLEQCDATVDPLGYVAVFSIESNEQDKAGVKDFRVGVSFLAQREDSVLKAGYQAPMTKEAILLVEDRLGFSLR